MKSYAVSLGLALLAGCVSGSPSPTEPDPPVEPAEDELDALIEEGRQAFRYDTFGDEAFWGGTLRLHEAVAQLSPTDALALGLKVDVEALPEALLASLERGEVPLDDPASTLALLEADAVVGVTGLFTDGELTSVGIQCALCHSTVDDSFAPGIGRRLDGWASRDLDVGALIASAPDLSVPAALLSVDQDTLREVLRAWGPGRFDAQVFVDGKALGPDGLPHPTLLPPAFGLAGSDLHTWTGWGSVPYWNAFVAVLLMHGQGNFHDPRLDDPVRFPVAAAHGLGHVTVPADQDRVTPKLAALHLYQLSLQPPVPPEGSFDAAAAERGGELFRGEAGCAECHQGPAYTEPGYNLHTAEEIGIDDFQAQRSPAQGYRTAPLRGLFSHTRGGFYHDGRFPTLLAVLDHYDAHFGLGLTGEEKADLVEFLKSL
jgi:mono/diheme cytochrome c family protein